MKTDWKIQAILFKEDMPEEVKDAFEFIFSKWNLETYDSEYVGWLLNNFIFEKEDVDGIEYNKLIVDDWIASYGVLDKDTSVVLIKLND